jgi:hypothetical protein
MAPCGDAGARAPVDGPREAELHPEEPFATTPVVADLSFDGPGLTSGFAPLAIGTRCRATHAAPAVGTKARNKTMSAAARQVAENAPDLAPASALSAA